MTPKLQIAQLLLPVWGCKLVWGLGLGAIGGTSTTSRLTLVGAAGLDYSAVNEYMAAHYEAWKDRPYFPIQKSSGAVVEPVYNARAGVLDVRTNQIKRATLSSCGFQLDAAQGQAPRKVQHWDKLGDVRLNFVPEIRERIARAFEPLRVSHTVFWNPVLRDEHFEQSRPDGSVDTPTASFARYPHLDVDVHAYTNTDDFLSLIEKNALEDEACPRVDIKAALNGGRRFCIVNAWVNIDTQPVRHAPLGLLSTQYGPSTYKDALNCFPYSAPDMRSSRWYMFDGLAPDEVLLFCQYDRDARKPSDLWHCALVILFLEDGTRPTSSESQMTTNVLSACRRSSFDVRCLVVLDEVVPPSFDRFAPSRGHTMPSRLSVQESAEFCSQQADSRRQEPRI